MSDDENYRVGYGRPPKHSQYPPGVSGNKGRRKKVLENHKQMVARVRDEIHEIGGRRMTNFELSVRSVVAATIKSGKPRDLKILFELLDKHGALPEADLAAEAAAGAEKAIDRMMTYAARMRDHDPADVKAVQNNSLEEADIVIRCPTCGPRLKEIWRQPERVALKGRYGCSGLQSAVATLFERKR